MALGILVGIGWASLHVVGLVIVGIVLVLSWPLAIRMMGGLFVDVMTWGPSFRAIFRRQGYGALFGGGLLGLAAYAVLYFIGLLLVHALGTVGSMIDFLISLFTVVALPVWMLAVYRAVHAS